MPPTPARLAFLAAEWREAVDEDPAIQAIHLLAPQLVVPTLIASEADALTEAAAVQTLRGQRWNRYDVVLPVSGDVLELDLGDEVTLTHARYGLSAGAAFVVLGIYPDAAAGRVRLSLWGQPL